jgi:hypothetical protein
MSGRLMRVIGNYETKLRLGARGRLSEEQIAERVGRFGIAAAREDNTLEQVRQVLCSHGVDTIWFVYYHAYSRELAKLSRRDLSIFNRDSELTFIVAKWALRGLVREVLLVIANQVFNLDLPTPPSDA